MLKVGHSISDKDANGISQEETLKPGGGSFWISRWEKQDETASAEECKDAHILNSH